jgi:hypothetical protein
MVGQIAARTALSDETVAAVVERTGGVGGGASFSEDRGKRQQCINTDREKRYAGAEPCSSLSYSTKPARAQSQEPKASSQMSGRGECHLDDEIGEQLSKAAVTGI